MNGGKSVVLVFLIVKNLLSKGACSEKFRLFSSSSNRVKESSMNETYLSFVSFLFAGVVEFPCLTGVKADAFFLLLIFGVTPSLTSCASRTLRNVSPAG